MKNLITAMAAALALTACATGGAGPSPMTPSGAGRPTGALDLGDWRGSSQRAVADRFSATIAQRYAQGAPLTQATADLTSQRFSCAAGQASGRGAPPAQICRREIRQGDCAHTWQVHLYATQARLARTRALYDRTCGDDGLLGG